MSRFLKFLHELGSYGLAGGLAADLVVLARSSGPDVPDLIFAISLWVLAPSMVIVLLSGLLAMMVRPVFFSKGWVWLKVFLTVPTVYATIAIVPGVAALPPDKVTSLLWIALVAIALITALSVWRPKDVLGMG